MWPKTSDFSAIPLCAFHHRENPDSYHPLRLSGLAAYSCGPGHCLDYTYW
jgi:hypothetical protein